MGYKQILNHMTIIIGLTNEIVFLQMIAQLLKKIGKCPNKELIMWGKFYGCVALRVERM